MVRVYATDERSNSDWLMRVAQTKAAMIAARNDWRVECIQMLEPCLAVQAGHRGRIAVVFKRSL